MPPPDLILHHEPASPFSEKVRLALGFKQLACQSVVLPAAGPGPQLLALTGGWRHTPWLQVGADVFADTALICDVLEHVQPEPTLYPQPLRGCSRIFAQWADTTLFWTAMAYDLQPRGRAELAASAPHSAEAWQAQHLSAPLLPPHDAAAALRSYLRRIASMVEEHDYLFGAEPCVADLAAYHPLWFTLTRVPGLAGILAATPAVVEWMDRIAELGHGRMEAFGAEDALTVASRAEPQPHGAGLLVDSAFQDEHGIALGARVRIRPEAFVGEAIEGELIAATRTHYSLRREDPQLGGLHLHLPRIGYVLEAA